MRFENLIALGAFAPTALVHGACLPIDADHPGARHRRESYTRVHSGFLRGP